MLVRFCLFFLAGGLSGLKAQNTASVQLNVRLEPIQLLTVQHSTEKQIPRVNNLQVTSTYGYTVRLHRERTENEKKYQNVSDPQVRLRSSLKTQADVQKIISHNRGTEESFHSVSFEKYQKTPSQILNDEEVPHYVYTIVSL